MDISMDISMDVSMDISMNISMDISMDISVDRGCIHGYIFGNLDVLSILGDEVLNGEESIHAFSVSHHASILTQTAV